MGCRHSKQAVVVESPTFEFSVAIGGNGSLVLDSSALRVEEKPAKLSSSARFSVSFRLGSLRRSVEAEQASAGWPTWLTTVASEAIHGMVPLPADNFVKLAKIGQGSYSSVFRARDVESGRIVALKKVRFDNVQRESIRFMAREILFLRRLHHPNIIKLEGIISSRLSSSIYLVFEYMEHDLSGLIYSPEISFTESQVKCYMQQLLAGIEHCHSKSIMHRDIKASNILLNNEGILKVADFGLANSTHKKPLTSRVVTLWYRPPELLLGSTNYGVSIDLWSVGCVFAEILLGKPILKGRTEVEQLHKIMKLCGSPTEDFWKKSKLPYATMFKPHQPYASSLRHRCRDLPEPSVNLLQTLLSIEPQKRGTASSALLSEYFRATPIASSPSSLPSYLPTKEIDARRHVESTRHCKETEKTPSSKKCRGMKAVRQHSQQTKEHLNHRINDGSTLVPEIKRSNVHGLPLKPSLESLSKISEGPYSSSPTESISYVWEMPARENLNNASTRSYTGKTRGTRILSESSSHTTYAQEWSWRQGHNKEVSGYFGTKIGARDSYKIDRHTILKLKQQFERPETYDESIKYHSQQLTSTCHDNQGRSDDEKERFEFSGPQLSQWEYAGDELLQRHDQQMRQALHKTQMRSSLKQKTPSYGIRAECASSDIPKSMADANKNLQYS